MRRGPSRALVGVVHGARRAAASVAVDLDRLDDGLRRAVGRIGPAATALPRRVAAARPNAARWRSLRPLLPVLIAVVAIGGVALLTRDRPASGGDGDRGPVGVAGPTTPRASPLASPPATIASTPTAPASPTPPLSSEAPRVEVTRSAVRAWRDTFGTVKAQVVVEVRNDGPGPAALGSGTVSYTLNEVDGGLLYEGLFAYTFPSALEPAETAYLIDTATLEFVQPGEVGAVEVALAPAPAAAGSPRLRVEDVAWSEAASGGGLEVTGRVSNLGEEVHDALVAVILFDAQGGILGAVYDNADAANIAAGGHAEFRTAYPGTPPLALEDVADVLAIAFDP